MNKWKTAAKVAGSAVASQNAARNQYARASANRSRNAAAAKKSIDIHGTLLIAKKNIFGVTKFSPQFIKHNQVLYLWKNKREAVHGIEKDDSPVQVLPRSERISRSRYAAAKNVWRKVSPFQIAQQNGYGDVVSTTTVACKRFSDESEAEYFEAWESAIGNACDGGEKSEQTRSRVASVLMSDDDTVNEALREAENAVAEVDAAGSGRISLDLLSLLLSRVGVPVEHQAPLRQDLLSTEDAQATVPLGYIEDSCFFAWFAALKKNELRAGAGGIHAARLVQSLQRIGLNVPLPLNPIADVDGGAWNQQWQELLEAEASARTMETAVRSGMAVVDFKGKFIAESTRLAIAVAAQHLLPTQDRLLSTISSCVKGASAAYVHKGMLFQVFADDDSSVDAPFCGSGVSEVFGASLIRLRRRQRFGSLSQSTGENKCR